MASMDQPLLDSPKKSIFRWRNLFLILSSATVLTLAALVTLHLAYETHVCDHAHDPISCQAIVSDIANTKTTKLGSHEILEILLQRSLAHLDATIALTSNIHRRINDPKQQAGLSDCMDLMDLSRTRIEDSLLALVSPTTQSYSIDDIHTWLSGVLTNHVTCTDDLRGGSLRAVEAQIEDLMAMASTSLAIVKGMYSPSHVEAIRPLKGGFPSWVTGEDRKLLEASSSVKANVTVAKDGSGKFKTVQEAVSSAPDNSKSRYVIHVKKGTYKEQVEVGEKKKNIMIVGDGMDSTIITGSLNVVDGSTTFNSATLAAVGDGFIAQDIWFKNTAGPKKMQAVALRVGADKSVMNRCRIDGYQDTLYAQSLRQFYRDCLISGTVDFIFGNAAVVFQSCNIVALRPMSQQKNTITAQGRTDPNQNTATSIQKCRIVPSSDLRTVESTFPTYLGRPWKEFSTTVFMESYIDNHVDPAGWLEWEGDFALRTLYYGEYANSGPGAGTSKRVKWSGYHVIKDANEAQKFTVKELIQGDSWLKSTGVSYSGGL